MFAEFLNWSGWEAAGVIVSIIFGVITVWMTAKLKSKQDTQNNKKTVQSTPILHTDEGQPFSTSVQKNIFAVVSLIIIVSTAIWLFAESVFEQHKQSLEDMAQSAPVIDEVDGQAYNQNKHKNIVALVVYRHAVNGKKVLGFTSLQKAKQYEQIHLNEQQKETDGFTYFYEHVSLDLQELGNKLPVRIGTNVPFVGSSWNDEISSMDVHPQSKVQVYEDSEYTGAQITFINNNNSNERSRWFIDLSRYNFTENADWNDCVSSLKTW